MGTIYAKLMFANLLRFLRFFAPERILVLLGAVTEVMAAGYLAPLEQKRSFPSNCLALSLA